MDVWIANPMEINFENESYRPDGIIFVHQQQCTAVAFFFAMYLDSSVSVGIKNIYFKSS